MKVKVNIERDFSMGVLCHHFPFPPAVTVSIEMIIPQIWFPGCFLWQNKFARTVRHRGQWICQDGHDVGPLIPDITIPPANPWYPVMWLFSSRSMVWSAHSVKMDGEQTGLAQGGIPFAFGPNSYPLLPMMTCGEPIFAPTAIPISNWTNTVIVGMTAADLIAGMLSIALSIAIDILFYRMNKIGKAASAGKVGKKPAMTMTKRWAGGAKNKILKKVVKTQAKRKNRESGAGRWTSEQLSSPFSARPEYPAWRTPPSANEGSVESGTPGANGFRASGLNKASGLSTDSLKEKNPTSS